MAELRDPRVDAVVSMARDAAAFGRDGLAEITVPVMAMGGTADGDSPLRWGTQLSYEYPSSPRKVQITSDGAEHLLPPGSATAFGGY